LNKKSWNLIFKIKKQQNLEKTEIKKSSDFFRKNKFFRFFSTKNKNSGI